MSLNSIVTSNIIRVIADIERRANNLQAQLQGAPISRVRIGDATITSAKIADLSITTAKIQDGAITNAKVADLSATSVTAGTISADRIASDSITADKLNVSTLSAISADFGTLTAGSITGTTITSGLVRTSSDTGRIYLSQSGSTPQIGFLDGGNFKIAMQHNLCYFYGAGFGFAELGASSSRAVVGVSSTTGNFIYGSTDIDLILFQALNAEMFIGWVNSGEIQFIGTFQINGSTKTAIVPTSKGYRALYAVESPDVWFFDIAESIDDVDSLFWEVTEGEYKTVTNKNGQLLVFRKRKGFATIRFEQKTKEQFIRNNNLYAN